MARFTRADLDDDLAWTDVLGVSVLAGIGFTVSLLIGELAFGAGSERDDHVKVGVLAGSVLAGSSRRYCCACATVYRQLHEVEQRDAHSDGVPDVFEREG